MDKENKELYKDITPKEKKVEIGLLKEDIKKLEKLIKSLKDALNYLTNK